MGSNERHRENPDPKEGYWVLMVDDLGRITRTQFKDPVQAVLEARRLAKVAEWFTIDVFRPASKRAFLAFPEEHPRGRHQTVSKPYKRVL